MLIKRGGKKPPHSQYYLD